VNFGNYHISLRPARIKLGTHAATALILAHVFVLSGCTTSGPIKSNKPESQAQVESTQPTPPPAKKYAPMSPETLYDLMIAEMAGKVNRPDIALGNYMRQAHSTNDIAVIERYARIASFMRANQATLDATTLWLKQEPTNPTALQLLLEDTIRNDKAPAIEAALRKLVPKNKLNIQGIEQELIAIPEEQHVQLQKALNPVIKDNKNNHILRYMRARSSIATKDYKQALADTQFIEKNHKSFPPALIVKIEALEKLGQPEEALEALEKLSQIDPANKQIRIYYARALIQNRKMETADEIFKQLVTDFPDDLDLQLTAGILAAELQKIEQANAYFAKLLQQNHRVDEIYLQQGMMYEVNQEPNKAISAYLQVNDQKHIEKSRLRAAKLAGEAGDTQKAIQILEAAIEKQPQHRVNYEIAISEVLTIFGTPADALTRLNKLLKTNPDQPDLLHARAMVAESMDRMDIFETDLRRILKKDPNNSAVLNALGYTFANKDIRLDEAKTLIEKALKIDPKSAPILDSMGWVYFKLGDLAKAREYLAKAYKIVPDHEIAAHYGEILWLSGEEAKAKKIWQAALEHTPDSKIIQSTMKRLDP